jgi:hypothetical protein
MADNKGSPKTLKEAIEFGMCMGELKDLPKNVENMLKEYINNRCGAAILEMDMWRAGHSTKYTPEDIVRNLHARLVNKPEN